MRNGLKIIDPVKEIARFSLISTQKLKPAHGKD
jgi:hypothetical protein